MNSIQKLTELFADFPGIGPRQARRFVYFLLTRNDAYLRNLTDLIHTLKQDIKVCESCFRFFQDTSHDHHNTLCDICRNPSRDLSLLVIVSRDVDLENIEKTHAHNGLYFVLGGSVPILEKNPESRIRSRELVDIVKKRTQNVGNIEHNTGKKFEQKLQEIIVAMNATPEGENTGDYVEHLLRPLISEHTIKITHLGRGISTGTELEYSDADTIKNALKNRQ